MRSWTYIHRHRLKQMEVEMYTETLTDGDEDKNNDVFEEVLLR